ncbi:hypothetical protein DLJ49_06585 [Rhodovulum sp. 12E13]|uniref:YrbL family protein n=1 Tax=Rhodovulum sp. 12E13 TaxID=2203891 RepID=UPI000E1A06D4|nr:YrbL family protein [Rhodovulum sp. 12E13]RDC73774.1 hypothetical protein DLJ49_06585 [Rhodovulum sp. 12E13]
MDTSFPPPQGLSLPRLAPEEALARGSERAVFDWPDQPGLLIKVMHPHALRRDARGGVRDPVGQRERRAWQAALAYATRTRRPPPVAEVIACLPWGSGTAHIVRKVADADGRMGPTLALLADQGRLGDAEIEMLNDLVADLQAAGIVVHDARPANFVLETSRHGASRFVLVDGFGDRALVPLRSWLPVLARRRLATALYRTARETGLHWDGRRLSRP